MRKDWVLVCLLALAAGFAGLWLGRYSFDPVHDGAAPIDIGQRRPELRLNDVDGQPQAIAAFDGEPLLINYWATWCAPCVRELPKLADIHARRKGSGLRVVAIALEYDAAPVAGFLAEHRIALPVWLETPGASDSSVQLGNLRSVLPFNVLVDAQGRVVDRREGELDPQQLDSWIAVVKPRH